MFLILAPPGEQNVQQALNTKLENDVHLLISRQDRW